jgi:hypothetical protein
VLKRRESYFRSGHTVGATLTARRERVWINHKNRATVRREARRRHAAPAALELVRVLRRGSRGSERVFVGRDLHDRADVNPGGLVALDADAAENALQIGVFLKHERLVAHGGMDVHRHRRQSPLQEQLSTPRPFIGKCPETTSAQGEHLRSGALFSVGAATSWYRLRPRRGRFRLGFLATMRETLA